MEKHTNYMGPEWEDCHTAKEAILGGLEGWRQKVQGWPRKCACEVVRDCAGANTYRAFRRIEKPSRIFRSWGWTFVKSGRLEKIAEITAHPQDFDDLHGDLISYVSTISMEK
jgi:hypothetical protein